MAGKTSRENGRKGGRPKSNHTLSSEVARELIAKELSPRIPKIVKALAKKAESGDVKSAKELFDRAYGRPLQPVEQSLKIVLSDVLRSGINRDRKKYSH